MTLLSMSPIKALIVSGSARVSTTLISIIRTKVVAVLLGPEGIGLLGLLSSIQEVGAQIADGGMSHSGVRQLARARNTPARLARIRLAMAFSILSLAVIAAAAVWIFRSPISEQIAGTNKHTASFGLLGAGIAALMIFRWKQALLCGFQKVAAHSALTIAAAALGTIIGITAILVWGLDGIVWAVLMPSIAGILLAPFFMRSLGTSNLRFSPKELNIVLSHAQSLFRLGIGLMLSAVAVFLTPMILRIFLSHDAGLEQVGYYHAGLVISLHLTAVITAAVAMDYYPRLSAVATSPEQTEILMNQQVRLHLVIGVPAAACVAISGPHLLQLLFSEEFTAATAFVQCMMAGTVVRLVAVPAEMVLMARAQSGVILRLQLAHQSFVLTVALILWPVVGLAGLGIAFSVGQVVHLFMLTFWNRQTAGIFWRLSRPRPLPC